MDTKANQLMVQPAAPAAFNFFDAQQFDTMQRVCNMFINSELVPKMYQNQGNTKESRDRALANCMIAIETAGRIGASPLMVMQNMYIVYGQPAWSSKFLTATVNSCGRYNSLKYRFENLGDIELPGTKMRVENWQCTAYTTEKGSTEVLESVPVSVGMAVKEGWYTKSGSKWQTLPKLMLQYRSATFWTRAYAPELSMGLKTEDETIDIQDAAYEDVTEKVEREKAAGANKTQIGFQADGEPKSAPQPAATPTPATAAAAAPVSSGQTNNIPGF
jgi:hypothetical protein